MSNRRSRSASVASATGSDYAHRDSEGGERQSQESIDKIDNKHSRRQAKLEQEQLEKQKKLAEKARVKLLAVEEEQQVAALAEKVSYNLYYVISVIYD